MHKHTLSYGRCVCAKQPAYMLQLVQINRNYIEGTPNFLGKSLGLKPIIGYLRTRYVETNQRINLNEKLQRLKNIKNFYILISIFFLKSYNEPNKPFITILEFIYLLVALRQNTRVFQFRFFIKKIKRAHTQIVICLATRIPKI